MHRPRRVAVALGSGGARGYAHIGVLRILEERGFEVAGVAGTSMGALVDGGLMDPIPVAATASVPADLTIAVSLSEDHPTVAGAGTVQETADVGEEAGRTHDEASRAYDSEVMRTLTGWLTTGRHGLRHAVAELGTGDGPGDMDDDLYEPLPTGLRTFDVMQLALDALQGVVTRYQLAGHPPDVLITIPPRASCRTLDFHRADELIAVGRARATAALDATTDGRYRA